MMVAIDMNSYTGVVKKVEIQKAHEVVAKKNRNGKDRKEKKEKQKSRP
jgi:hypothetical protein